MFEKIPSGILFQILNNMEKKTKKELVELCKENGIKGYSKKNKKELIELLNGTVMTISRESAEKSADEWMPIIREWMIRAIMDPEQHRDIGKVLAQATEIVGVKMLNEMSGRTNKIVVGKSYDSITDDNLGPVVRSQIKFRMGDWHFETTRRNSQKNADTNATGHVAYRKDEFDMVAIFTPSSTFGISGSKLRCIPTYALINPEKPDQIVTRILSGVRKIYDTDSKTQEVINELFN
jgi:hypothetical protein